ncbi:MAG: AAA family ATPase [Chloroflexales bacterium]|nr:AAA family ATPase [Chloroflexales bacterium]
MEHPTSFGYWLRRQRKVLDLTQEELARLVGCAVGTIKSIEADKRRPSKQLAQLLADGLQLGEEERPIFIKAARSEFGVDQLPVPGVSPGAARSRRSRGAASSPALNACPTCGAEAGEDRRFCSQCGTLLKLTCDACGAESLIGTRMCSACGGALEPAAPVTTAAGNEHGPSIPKEERRWVTVLFADISGFTSLAEQLDVEEIKVLTGRCIERMCAEIRQFGGTLVNIMGDAVLAAFGAPVAHEDDAARAVRAAIAIRDSLPLNNLAYPSKVHIGVNTGEVLATIHGPQEHRHYTVLGDVVNTADRILNVAPPGCVLVGEETYRATRKAVHYRELVAVVVKGKEHPVQVWEALSVAMLPEARAMGTAPLIGRGAELALLQSIWARVVGEAEPHLATVIGEPGIGKSRLSAEFVTRLDSHARVLHGRCLPYGTTLSYWPLATMLREAAGITADDEREVARDKLSALVAKVIWPDQGGPDEVALHLALLAGLDTEADRAAPAGDQKTLHASARRFFEAFARQHPLCLVFEDIHWADAALLDLIELAAARIREAPLLILAQARPELLECRAAWGRGVRGFVSLPLSPLSELPERELVLALCREHDLPEFIAARIGRGPNGNPLFAEEIVAMAAERGQLTGVPNAIKALIAARVDALPGSERELLQLAAVFGKAFWASGLHTLDVRVSQEVHGQLDALEAKDLIRAQVRSQFPDDREYYFKHDLIRDVIYEMLPKAERRTLHARIVDWMERAAGEHVNNYLDQLAHHAIQSGHHQRAIEYLVRAAERASHAADYRQAAVLLKQGLTLAEDLGLRTVVADLHARRGKAFVNVSMWAEARPELEAALAELPVEQQAQRALVLIDLATVCFWMLDIAGLRRYADEAMALAELVNRDDIVAGALAVLALAHSSDGEPQRVASVVEQSLQRAGEQPIAAVTFGVAILSLNFYWLGRFDESVAGARHAVEIARGMNDTQFISYSLPHAGLALAARGAYTDAEEVFRESQQFCREYEIWPNLARVIAMTAGYHLDVFDFSGHEAIAEEARELARSANLMNPLVSASLDLLFNYIRREDVGRAERIVHDVAATVEQAAGAHGWLWRLKLTEARAELALTRGDWDESLRLAESAITQSQKRGRLKYEAFGRETRARALAAVGRRHEAIAEARSGVALLRPLDAPALFLRAASTLLGLEGDDALLGEARHAAQRIITALPSDALRRRFEAAEPVRILNRPRARNGN